jgi:hypothetical protein
MLSQEKQHGGMYAIDYVIDKYIQCVYVTHDGESYLGARTRYGGIIL